MVGFFDMTVVDSGSKDSDNNCSDTDFYLS